jgi:hypothetical protein
MLITKSVMEAITNDLTTNGIAEKGSVVITDKGVTIDFAVSDEYLPKCIAKMHVCLFDCAENIDKEGERFIPVSALATYLDERDGETHYYYGRYPVYNEVVGPVEVMNALLWDVGDKSLHDYFDHITRCN